MEKSSIYEISAEAAAPEASRAADRALDILEFLESRDEPQTLSQIVAGLGLPRATAHRLLATLRERGYAAQPRPRGGYTLGLRVLQLAARSRERLVPAQVALPYLRKLAAATGESCQLSVRSGQQALCVARVPSPQHSDVSLAGQVGSVFPLHATAVGKVLLAYAPRAEWDALFARPPRAYTPQTHVAASAIESELREVRRTGLAEDHEEYKRGLSALAAAVFDEDGAAVAAVALPLFTSAAADGLEAKRAHLRAAAKGISGSLGFGGVYPGEERKTETQ